MFDADIMLLTGAGASIPVQIPGMAGMVREFKNNHPQRDPARRAYENTRELGVPDDLEEVLQFCNRLTELRSQEISKVIHKAVAPRGGKKLKAFKRQFAAEIREAERLKAALIRWIGRTCLRFDRSAAESLYSEIVALLARQAIPVFTTNYDGVLDVVAERQGIPVADNFVENEVGRKFWDPSHRAFSGDGLRLVKMHGSIYWHSTSDGGAIEKLRQPAPENAEGEALEQLLIFPTRFKDIYQQNYFPLYSAFTRTLGVATTLVVIGHSLRDEYLLAAIRERLKDASFGLVIVDVEMPPVARELEGRILFLEGGVEQYQPLLCRALSDHAPSGPGFFSYLEGAQEAIRRGRKEKIRCLDGVPSFVSPGERLQVSLELETLSSEYKWGAALLVNKKWIELHRSGTVLKGYGTKRVSLAFDLPDEIERGGSYPLRFSLWDQRTGKQAASSRRTVRVRKKD